jgi:hypothetical protein
MREEREGDDAEKLAERNREAPESASTSAAKRRTTPAMRVPTNPEVHLARASDSEVLAADSA